ncbi:hypothetical protein Tco_0723924 [Tanacetum coccineum]
MVPNFSKLDKFEGVDFKRWQKKMHFLLSTMSMVYVLNTPIPNDGDDATVKQIRRRNKWDNDNCIEESLWVQDSDKPKSNNVDGPLVVNMVKHNNSIRLNIVNDNIGSAFVSTSKLNDSIPWHARLGHVHFKRAVVRLPDPKLNFFGERSIECIFVGYVEHSKAFKFYVIEPNESVSIYSIIKSRDVIFNENRFSSVPRPSHRSLINGTKDIGGSVVPKKVTEESVRRCTFQHWFVADFLSKLVVRVLISLALEDDPWSTDSHVGTVDRISLTSCEVFGISAASEDEFVGVGAVSAVVVDAVGV